MFLVIGALSFFTIKTTSPFIVLRYQLPSLGRKVNSHPLLYATLFPLATFDILLLRLMLPASYAKERWWLNLYPNRGHNIIRIKDFK